MKKKLISVIIPTFNRSKLLVKCLNSLINQTIKPDEIIIIDNSVNKSAKDLFLKYKNKIKKVEIRYFSEKRKGTSFARNLGIINAKGKYLLFIDDDCIADKFLIENYLKALKKNPIILGGVRNGSNNIYSFLENLSTKHFFQKGYIKKDGGYYSFFIDSKNFVINRLFLLKNNLYFDNNYAPYCIFEDIELGLRISLLLKKKIVFEKDAFVYHYGRDNFLDHIKREWRKGRGYAYFIKDFSSRIQKHITSKEEIEFLINFYKNDRLNFIKENVKKFPFKKKFFLFLLIGLDYIFFSLGFFYESFLRIINHRS